MSEKSFEIRDVIYGFIKLDDQERNIISDPAFQRLRRIRQLSLTEMVYPGANHTRFEHSLGVMQMASDMYDCIVDKSPQALTDLGINESGIVRWRKVVRLAALLHDVGHAPFSHSGENLLPFKDDKREKRYSHEDYSIEIIKQKFKSYIEDHAINRNFGITVNEVTALLGDTLGNDSAFNSFVLLWKSLISGQVDADRADYLLRDSIHSGVSYGLYDRNRLTRCMAICFSETDAPIIAIKEGGWHIAEALVIARYQMFTQLYFHKVRRIYDYHISNAAKEILVRLQLEQGCYPNPQRIDEYLWFDDWVMWGELKKGNGGTHGNIILNREHYKCVFQTDVCPSDSDRRKIEQIKSEKENENLGTYLDNPSTTWYKIDKDISILSKNGIIIPLSELSGIVKSMNTIPLTTRLYVERKK